MTVWSLLVPLAFWDHLATDHRGSPRIPGQFWEVPNDIWICYIILRLSGPSIDLDFLELI